jgi:hypothetical protein
MKGLFWYDLVRFNMSKRESVILKIPVKMGGTPWMQATKGNVVIRARTYLRDNGFPKAQSRNDVYSKGVLKQCEFHRFDDKDNEAGLLLLDHFLEEEYEIDKTDIMYGEFGSEIRATVYHLSKDAL